MASLLALTRRELLGYLVSPLSYAIASVYVALSGYLFLMVTVEAQAADLRLFFGNLSLFLLLVAPLLTMRLLAQERRQGTDELLLTLPLTTGAIVAAKFAAVLVLLCAMLALTLVVPLLLARHVPIPAAELAVGYLGVLLLGAAFLAVGMLASALTRHPIVAGALAFGFLMAMGVLGWLGTLAEGTLGEVLEQLALWEAADLFYRGVLDLGVVVLYLTLTAAVLFVTTRVVEYHAWS